MIKKSAGNVNESWFALGVIVSVGVLLWGSTLGFGFVWDDLSTVVGNPSLDDPRTLYRAFLHDFWGLHGISQESGYWRPIPTIFYFFVYQLFGEAPSAYHFLNLILHVSNALLVFFIARRWLMTSGQALFVSILFLVHPMQSETVAFVSALPDLLFVFFGLLGTWIYIQEEKKISHYFGVSLFLLLSLLSKEAAISFPLIWFFLSINHKGRLKSFSNLWVVLITAVYIVLHYLVVGDSSFRPLWGDNLWQHLGTSLRLLWVHLGLNLLPLWTSPTRVIPISSGFSDLYAWSALFLVLTTGMLLWSLRKSQPVLFRGAGIWFLAFLPYSNLIPGEGLIADRYFYLEIFGLGITLVGVLQAMPERTKVFFSNLRLLIPALALVSLWSFSNVLKWANEEKLWSAATRTDAGSTLAWSELGKVQLKKEEFSAAEESFKKALRLRPSNKKASFNLALTLIKDGRPSEAKESLLHHLSTHPEDFMAMDLMASLLMTENHVDQAIEYQEGALVLAPNNWKVHFNAGTLYLELGNWVRAKELLERARVLAPNRREVSFNLAAALVRAREIDAALKLYEDMMKRWPNDEEIRRNHDAVLRWRESR